jgi:hypothetical protein
MEYELNQQKNTSLTRLILAAAGDPGFGVFDIPGSSKQEAINKTFGLHVRLKKRENDRTSYWTRSASE